MNTKALCYAHERNSRGPGQAAPRVSRYRNPCAIPGCTETGLYLRRRPPAPQPIPCDGTATCAHCLPSRFSPVSAAYIPLGSGVEMGGE